MTTPPPSPVSDPRKPAARAPRPTNAVNSAVLTEVPSPGAVRRLPRSLDRASRAPRGPNGERPALRRGRTPVIVRAVSAGGAAGRSRGGGARREGRGGE